MKIFVVCILMCLLWISGCVEQPANGKEKVANTDVKKVENKAMLVQGDSLVLAKSIPGYLCFGSLVKGSVSVRSTFLANQPDTVNYTEGQDYVVNYAEGTVARTAESRIKDYSTNVLYGKVDFNHGNYAGFGNLPFFVFVDYKTTKGAPFARPNDQSKYLAKVRAKLEAGGPFLIATYGDSITAGGEATKPELRFQARYGEYLKAKFPKAQIEVKDVSISGYASQQGVDWFDDTRYMGQIDKADLVLVGWGMNDHNIGTAEPEVYKHNLIKLVGMLRERKGAEVILFSTFPPNDNWHYGTHRMGQFAEAARQAAAETKCAYIDVYSTWMMVLKRKDQSSLLGNNINHPNDFGHWLYEQAFEAMKF